MTKDYEWRISLNVGDTLDCYDRGKWYPSTVISKSEDISNEFPKVDYKIGFRVYPEYFKEWSHYTKFWPDKMLLKDKEGKEYYGDADGMDEWINSSSKRIQKLDTMTSGNASNDSDNYYIDDFIPFEVEGKKNYIIARNNSFSYYFAMMLTRFAEFGGYEQIISFISTKPNSDIINFILIILGSSFGLLHKEFIKRLTTDLQKNIIQYINSMSQNDIRNIKKETIELMSKVLKYYLSVSLPVNERNEIIEKFTITIALKMLKTTFLDKRISAVKSIIDTIRSEKSNPGKSDNLLKLIEENQIFYEIYGPNSHIQLINKSKELLEIMLEEDKLSNGEIEMIWNATKKGDIEGKLTILKTLKEISHSLKDKHIKMFLDNIYSSKPEDLTNEEIDLVYELSTHQSQPSESHEKCIKFFLQGLFLSRSDEGDKINIIINKIFEATINHNELLNYVISTCFENVKNIENTVLSLNLISKYLNDKESRKLVNENELDNLYINNFKNYKELVKNQMKSKDVKDVDLLALDNFTHSQNLKARLEFINVLINNNLWKVSNVDPIDFLYDTLVLNNISDKDVQEFYKWIKKTIDMNVELETEERIFKLFNDKICKDTISCQNLSIQALESYLKVFLNINFKANNLYYYKDKAKYEIVVLCNPENLIGFDILWKIIFESYSDEIMNKGIQTLHSLYNNIKDSTQSHADILLKKCIDLIKDTVESSISEEAKKNKIVKCLYVLKLMIEESEKKGTVRVKSHLGLLKHIVITLKINSFINKVPDGNISLYGNTTVWDLRELLSKKIGIAVDFFKLSIKGNEIQEVDNGKTLLDLGLQDDDEIRLYMNDIDRNIPQVELVRNGEVVPELTAIFNEWFDRLSTDGKLLRENTVKFVKSVTNCRDDIGVDDHRVAYMFSSYDPQNLGYISKEAFLSFYYDAVLKPEKKGVVWENLRNMGIRNDLKKFDEPYERYNSDRTLLPRFKLAHNDIFFNTIFVLQDLSDSIAKEAFDFLCLITTNPIIYKQILEGKDWNNILYSENIYKLIYSLQIIESFLEDIEIYSSQVDCFSSEEYILGEVNTTDEIKEKKIDWMVKFIQNNGFNILVDLLHSKLEGYKNNDGEPVLMNTICLKYLIKIIRIIFFSSLTKHKSFRDTKIFSRHSDSTDNQNLEVIFEGELGDIILSSFDYQDMTKKLISLLSSIINKNNKLNDDKDIIENTFEMLICIIAYSDDDNILLKENRKEFRNIVVYGLLNQNQNIRMKFANSLVRLVKICHERSNLINHLFEESYELIVKIDSGYEKQSAELFEFFANIFEIYIKLDKTNSIVDQNEFLMKIAKSVSDDINNKVGLSNEIFIGYLKILSKVFSSIKDDEFGDGLKARVSKEFNLIQGIMSKVLFKHSSSELINKLEGIEYVNPDKFNDSKANRNSNQNVRNECYSFILSMLKNSIANFEKFFSVNVLDDKKVEKKERNEVYTRHMMNNSGRNEGHVGLYNPSCICYMNSMLQQFFMVPTYRYSVLQSSDAEEPNTNNAMNIDDNAFHQLQRMFSYLELSDREDYVPNGFCYAFKDWEGNPTNMSIQQDAQEFLARFFDKIETSLRESPNKYLLQSVFGGKTCSQLLCAEGCGTAKNRYEDFYTLSLEVNKLKNVYDSLEKFILPEKIDEYNCDTCNKKVTITKRNLLAELPNVLVIHLQRLFFNYETERNEKINSRLEFPKVLNLKNFTLEEQTRKSLAKRTKGGEENEDFDKLLDTDDVYFKCDEYYEYHLVGVNVHLGSADAGHYFSYINSIRSGNDNHMDYDPNIETHTNSWLKFNDSRISKFNIEKLEEECFGGKMENNGEEWNFRSNNDSIQSAYMLVYERRIKSPLKLLVSKPEKEDRVISFKEEERLSINKKYNLMYHTGKPTYEEVNKTVFENIFYDSEKNEHYLLKPFYSVERLIHKNYYIEIIEDNSQLQKQQNISDEQFVSFFDSVISVLDETLMTIKNMSPETSKKMVSTYMNFLYNILSQKDKQKLLKTAKDKFIHILELSPNSLSSVFEFYNDNYKALINCLLNENGYIVAIHSEILFQVIEKAFKDNQEEFMKAAFSDDSENPLYINLIRLLDSIINLFPRIPSKFVNKVSPMINLFKDLGAISPNLLYYLASREIIFLLATFLLGKDSPCYADTIKNEKWDQGRPTPNCNQIVELIFSIWQNSKDSNPNSFIEISDRDRTCMKHPSFLKFIYKNSPQLFTEFLIALSTNNEEFTIQSCTEITKYIDDIAFYDDSELYKLLNAIIPIFQINDEFQMMRFNIIIGYPQMIMDEPNSRSNLPYFGFNNMSEYTSKVFEMKGMINLRYTSCLLKKIISIKSREKAPIEIFLLLLNACITNHALLKYLRHLPHEEPYFDDFIQWGITQVTHYTNKYDNTNYINMLKSIVEKINHVLPVLTQNTDLLKDFKSFTGKYLPKDIKKEVISLISKTDNLFILKCDYYTNSVTYSKDLDFSTSRAYYGSNANKIKYELDPEPLESTDEFKVFDMSERNNNEREFFRKIIPILETKPVVVYNKQKIEDVHHCLTRYIAFNSNIFINIRFI